MDKEHILLQKVNLSVRWAGPRPEERFDAGTLEELYLTLCKEGYEYRRFERIGADAGALMHGADGSECRIDSQRIVIEQSTGGYDFDTLQKRMMTLLELVTKHLRSGPLFNAMVLLEAVWPTQNKIDLREVFTPGLLQIHKEQAELLAADVLNSSFAISCTIERGGQDDEMHCTLDLAPDMTDPHRLRVTVDVHSHEVFEDCKELAPVLRHCHRFLMENAGSFVESLNLEADAESLGGEIGGVE